MARRASSSINPTALIGIAVAVVLLIVGGKMLLGTKTSEFGDVDAFDVEEFLENGNSLRNNVYLIEGTIDEKFFSDTSSHSVASVRVKTPGEDALVPIEIPAEFNNLNIEREQRYSFRVKVRQGGIPVATGINRL